MMPCDEYSELISAFIDGELSDEETDKLNTHLSSCPACRSYLNDIKKIHEECSTLAEDVPEGFSSRVMASVSSSEKAEKKFFLSRFKFSAIAAVIALIVLGVSRLDSFSPEISEDTPSIPQAETMTREVSHAPAPATLSPISDSYSASLPNTITLPGGENYATHLLLYGEDALSLFSEHTPKVFEGNYMIPLEKDALSDTLSLIENSGISYYRYEGDSTSPNFVVIIIP